MVDTTEAIPDVESSPATFDALEEAEVVKAIRIGIAAVEAGRVWPARLALADLGKRLGIPG